MRNRNIFGPPGIAYVYLSYGTHKLLNIVCEPEGVGSAVLIRALRPLDGEDLMERRRGRARDLCNGPGRLTQALGVDLSYDGQDLSSGSLTISGVGAPTPEGLVETTRIGITRGTDLPWRYLIDGDEHVSVRPKTISGRR
jgi:DNA-3-methyladenine glycosylase